MQTEVKKAGIVSLVALILSVIFSLGAYLLGKVTNSFAVFALSWQILAGAFIWAVLAIQFYQRVLAEQEKLDMQELERSSGDTIFESQKSHRELFAVAQNRLRIFEKWILPVFSFFIALYELAMSALLIRFLLRRYGAGETSHLLIGAVLTVSIAFLSFLFSLFATGLSRQQQWRPLRAGGSYLLATAILSFGCAAALAFAQFKVLVLLTVFDWVVPVILGVLGLEAALNFVLDIYRPRLEEQYNIIAFDSRLLAIIGTPGNILQTAASAIDYQFGFKVSQTWFYRIMEQAVVPLIIVSAIILYLLSSIVIIDAGSQAIIEHFGSPYDSQGKVRLIGPGLTLKLPWPFDTIKKFPTKEIQEIPIGYVPDEDPDKQKVALLWGREHYKKEYNLLVAAESINVQEKEMVPVSIIRAAIPVQYRVVDLYKYLYGYNDSRKVLEDLCYREVVKFVASARIEPESEIGDSEKSLLGAGRAKAAAELVGIIQKEADQMGLGVEIVFMGLQGFHPPPEVSGDYQAVTGAVQKKQAVILSAIAQRDKKFTESAGSVKQAEGLYELAKEYTKAQQGGSEKQQREQQQDADKIRIELDNAFTGASGDLFAKLRQAQSYAYEKSTLAKATGRRFSQQLEAYQASKQIYKHELRMEMLEESLEKIRKYIVVAEGDRQVTIFNLEEKLVPSLYDIESVQPK